MLEIEKRGYMIALDEKHGHVLGLYDRVNPKANWVGERFGIPFIHGTQWGEEHLSMKVERWDDSGIVTVSETGATKVEYLTGEEELSVRMETLIDCGPRAGLQLNLNFLDMPGGNRFDEQCMPKVIYTDEECSYAYLVFGTADGRYCAILSETPFCAWRIQYNRSGHRMLGFQFLTQADDVVTDERPRLRTVNQLNLCILFESSVAACLDAISKRLNIGMAVCEISGGMIGADIPFQLTAKAERLKILSPGGNEVFPENGKLRLLEPGIYQLITENAKGRTHVSRVLCHKDWKSLYHEINTFYADHFQDESGAFYRVIWKNGLTPEGGRTLEGTAFGDIKEPSSCRSGEFGGFCAAAMMKNLLLFGPDEKLKKSVDRYIRNWALNEGHEQTPYGGSIFKESQEFLGRKYGPYHLYREVNYPQHEAFLMEQLVDYYRLTKDEGILEEAYQLARHFVEEHMEENGCVVCQNHPNEEKVDYCTVHVPVYGLILVGRALGEGERADDILHHAKKLADYVCQRGLSFPTEGDPCTEDGSMSCAAATLLYAYLCLEPKPEYLAMAEKLLRLHEILVLEGTDCRMDGSSIRFWETQYETRDWGPSINAGHAWSIWTAAAKAMMALVKGDFYNLLRAYEGFLTNICKVEGNGAMTSGYTPDMIPGMPHAPCIFGAAEPESGVSEYQFTTSRIGMRYPDRTYSTSGNYFLIEAAKFWSHISGFHGESGICVNGTISDGCFLSGATAMDCLVLGGTFERPYSVKCVAGKELTLLWERKDKRLTVDGARMRELGDKRAVVVPDRDEIAISFL